MVFVGRPPSMFILLFLIAYLSDFVENSKRETELPIIDTDCETIPFERVVELEIKKHHCEGKFINNICSGHCPSGFYISASGAGIGNCSACKPSDYDFIKVPLRCTTGKLLRHRRYKVVRSCKCQKIQCPSHT